MATAEDIIRFNMLFKAYDDIFAKAARKFRMPALSLWVLFTMREIPNCTQKDLCDVLLHSKQSIQSALDRLVQQGIVCLETDKRDRRCKQILLTDKGRELSERTADRVAAAEKAAFDKLTADERGKLIELFQRLHDAVLGEMEKL